MGTHVSPVMMSSASSILAVVAALRGKVSLRCGGDADESDEEAHGVNLVD